MGNHYSGHYDPIHEIDAALTRINEKNGWQIGIHVDGASGGFIAPFQKGLKPWDFRLDNVLSISASGHKFGQSVCGTGWVVWRQRQDLSEHVAISVNRALPSAAPLFDTVSLSTSALTTCFFSFVSLGRSESNCVHR